MPAKKKKTHFTITEAAKKKGVSRAAIHEAIQKGLLRARWGEVTVTKKVLLVTAESLDSYQVSKRHRDAGKKIADA
jgi:hypothetical protein